MTEHTPQALTASSMLSPALNYDIDQLSTQLVADATHNMPSMPDERFLQGRIFDTRQKLVQKLFEVCTPELPQANTAQAEPSATRAQQDFLTVDLEETWRDALPSLMLPPIRKIAHFSAWRTAFLAILGLLLGLALGQAFSFAYTHADTWMLFLQQQTAGGEALENTTALTKAQLSPTMNQGIHIFCGLLGAMTIVWLAEYMVGAMTLGRISFLGKVYRWKRFQRFCTLFFLVLLGLSIARDFFGAKLGILHLIQAFGLLLSSGQVLPLFTNIYGLLLFVFCFTLLLKRPLSFDGDDFAEKLHMAICQWWAGASLVGPLLYENILLKNDPTKAAWKKVGIELYSLAGELPEARGQWLEERLRRLGIEVTREQGKLFWSEEMAERYTPLGHIDVGDACFVDEPPLIEQGLLTRKGTVRKVRK